MHGCRQLVMRIVLLSQITSATLMICSEKFRTFLSNQTAGEKSEEGEDDVKSACPLRPGLHTCYNGQYKEMRRGDLKLTSKNWSQFRLQAATRLHEDGIASNRRSAIRR